MRLTLSSSASARPRRRLAVAAAALALVTAGCGSTVQLDGTAAGTAGQLDGSSLSGATEGGGIDPLTGAPTGTADGSAGGSTGSIEGGTDGSTGGTTGGGTGGTTGNTTGETGGGDPGETGDDASGGGEGDIPAESGPVKVGVMYLTGVDQVAGALGISGLSTGDSKAQATAFVDYLNDRGGLAGREIDLVYAPVASSDMANNPQSAVQAACTQLTEDDQVEFVVTYMALSQNGIACFAGGGVQVIDDASALTDAQMEQYADHLAAPGDIAPGRMITTLVDSLWQSGWLTKSSKVGAFSYDDTAARTVVEGALTTALRKYGLSLAEYQRVSSGTNGPAQSGSAVLRFRTAGVDRVIPVLANPLFLMSSASSQGYRPQYALYSFFGPGAFMETSAPRDQLTGAAGIGWSPYLDIGRGTKPGPVNSNETLCFQILSAAGQNDSAPTTKAVQLQLCTAFLYLAYAANKVGGAPSDLLVRARSVVKGTFPAPDTFKSDVSSRVDGVAAVRQLVYTAGCSCFQYGKQVTLR